MIGSVKFYRSGRLMTAILNDEWKWECEEYPSIVSRLEAECSMDDYTSADGAPGIDLILRAAELLGGTPHFHSETSKGDQK